MMWAACHSFSSQQRRKMVPGGRWALLACVAAGLLGMGPGAAASAAPDTVVTLSGDRLTGHIVSIGKEGVLRLTNSYLEREAGLRLGGLRQATLTGTAKETDPALVFLNNGDRIAGKLVAISSNEITIVSSVAGQLVIGRPFVQEIRIGPPRAEGPPRADFASGEFEPFKETGREGSGVFAAEYVQDKPTTVAFDCAEGNAPWSVSFFVADARSPRKSSMTLVWDGESFSFRSAMPQSSSSHGFGGRSDPVRNARMAYDPTNRSVSLWVNGQSLLRTTAGSAPVEGRYVVVECPGRMAIAKIEVLDGIVPPGAELEGTSRSSAQENCEAVVLTNGDRLSAQTFLLTNGLLTIKTEMADLPIPLDRLESVSFRKSGREAPPPPDPSAVQIRTPKSILTVEKIELNEKAATARSHLFKSTLNIDRAAIKSLRFSTDRPSATGG
jgi:hypothetical protein